MMPSAGFEPAIAVIERRQTYALDRTAIGSTQTYFYIVRNFLQPSAASFFSGPNIFISTLFSNSVT
jgi:hypothetical protein